MEAKTDNLETANAPDGGWEFNEEVATAFEDMLERSIPNYVEMRRMVTEAALWLFDELNLPTFPVLDIGCSRGGAIKPILQNLGVTGRFVGLEISEPMVDVAREEFAGWTTAKLPQHSPVVDIRHHDLRTGLPRDLVPQGAILSVLTLQFVPIEYRLELLGQVHDLLLPGGGFILVEKVLGSSPVLSRMEADIYHEMKRGQGYSKEAVDRKRLALEGKLVPLTSDFNEELLRSAGFRDVDQVWAWMNFRGWIAIKEGARSRG